jgi:hypothetical protein
MEAITILSDRKVILDLQNRFGLSEIQANVIYFQLQEHFTKNNMNLRQDQPDSKEED